MISKDTSGSLGGTFLTDFLQMDAEDELLVYDNATSTLTVAEECQGVGVYYTCEYNFYWKGFSKKPPDIGTEVRLASQYKQCMLTVK